MFIQEFGAYINKEYSDISFSPEQEESICKKVSGDALVRLEFVKTCIELIVKLAKWYSFENGVPFSQLVQIGVMAVIRASDSFNISEKIGFVDYLSHEIMKAMIEYSRPYSIN